MKKYKLVFIFMIVVFIVGALPLSAQPAEIPAEVAQAFSLSFETFFFVSMLSAFGQTIPGAILSDESIVFENLDLMTLELSDRGSYTTLNGTITGTEAESGNTDMVADVTLSGGPIRELEWTVRDFSIDSAGAYFQIVADGTPYTYEMAP